jgi:hypothetical protein
MDYILKKKKIDLEPIPYLSNKKKRSNNIVKLISVFEEKMNIYPTNKNHQ